MLERGLILKSLKGTKKENLRRFISCLFLPQNHRTTKNHCLDVSDPLRTVISNHMATFLQNM